MAEEIFNLKDEVLEVASRKEHSWTDDEGDVNYGKASNTQWGHVKVQSSILDNSQAHDNDCASIEAIKKYIKDNVISYIDDTDIGPIQDKYDFISYDSAEKTTVYGQGRVQIAGNPIDSLIPVKVLENSPEDKFNHKIFYITNDATPDGTVAYQLHQIESVPLYVAVTSTEESNIYGFISYADENKETEYGIGTVEVIQEAENGFIPVKVLTNDFDDSFVNKIFFIQDGATSDDDNIYQLHEMSAINIYVTIARVINENEKKLLSKRKVIEKINEIKSTVDSINFDTEFTNIENSIETVTNNLQGNINRIQSFNTPKKAETPIYNLKDPGYYYYENCPTIGYIDDDDISCGIVTVKKLNNSIVQYIESCNKSNNKLDGNQYKRVYDGQSWGLTEVIHRNIEYTPQDIKIEDEENRNGGQIFIKENNAGYIITWIQKGDKHFDVHEEQYEYEIICNFNQPLMIEEDVYIFGNLIGKMDVKITSDNIAVRSTLSPGNQIKNVHETYFIPRSR